MGKKFIRRVVHKGNKRFIELNKHNGNYEVLGKDTSTFGSGVDLKILNLETGELYVDKTCIPVEELEDINGNLTIPSRINSTED